MTRPLPLLAAALLATPALAQVLPPADALPLSQIVARVEALPDVARVLEVDWDDDGYWEAETIDAANRVREIRIDPRTGAEIPHRRR
ncbi:PepSY domain-containing protein [Amaricoccus sp.]|uniref:PepSY domain-containing protein n=1 Tax=Amaricoccus sp. TaxID=1872485 RepID=UPI001B65F02B|nr:PepSY domain-containing protein [Amaricoccus sp.]MBP7000945.1 PepSY domain-containing protein [Amaricoccus sp.]